MQLMQASTQWMNRPADERFTSLTDMLSASRALRDRAHARVVANRRLEAVPVDGTDHKGLAIRGDIPGDVALPTHWAFGQLAGLADAPASYLRKLPAEIASDCLNWGFQKRAVEETGLLAYDDQPAFDLVAATGPRYGRIWNADVIDALVHRFGDGVTGRFKVPGEFGRDVEITKANTTLYAGDRDMFVFLADEKNRVEIPNRRNGQSGLLARGFFLWNSEVGSRSMGITTFLFDYACCNRIVWGAEDVKTVTIRHSSGAPDRYIEEVAPALEIMAESSTHSITAAIEAARAARVDDIDDFLANRFTAGQSKGIKLAFEADENRPMENLWDITTGVTAYARGIEWQDARVDLERAAGKILKLAA